MPRRACVCVHLETTGLKNVPKPHTNASPPSRHARPLPVVRYMHPDSNNLHGKSFKQPICKEIGKKANGKRPAF